MLEGDRTQLSRAITLVESKRAEDQRAAQALIQKLLPRSGKASRIGITGIPGVGKSTFIEAFGCMLCDKGHRVAVLAIDPSSRRTGGSILGDKTRMDRLSREPNSFIRPSPAGETMGGVARKTREAMILCEAAGFDVMIVETMGVGQGETALRSMVDFFLLLVLPGAGDELQGIKRGVMEMADAVFINKADGDNLQRAESARGECSLAMGYMAPATPGWKSPVMMGSGLHGLGITEIWETIERFYAELRPEKIIEEQRRQQTLSWLKDLVQDELASRFFSDEVMRERMKTLEAELLKGKITPPAAVEQLFEGELCLKK